MNKPPDNMSTKNNTMSGDMSTDWIKRFNEKFVMPHGDLPLRFADDIKHFIASELDRREKEVREDLRRQIYQLDWIKILATAIASRPTSWRENPVWEWRNAADTINFALVSELDRQEITIDPLSILTRKKKL